MSGVLDGRQWARNIIARFNAGQTINRTALRFAHEALGLPLPKGCR